MTPDYTDESTPATQPVQPAQPYVNQPLRPWLNGFLEIWTGKGRTLKANTTQWRKIASTGLLIWIVLSTVSSYISSKSDGIRADNITLMKVGKSPNPSDNEQTPVKSSQQPSFSLKELEQLLSFSLITGFVNLFSISFLFWASYALIGGGVTFRVAVAGTGYSMAILSVESLVTALMQFAGNSLRVAPNAGFLVSLNEHPWLFGFFTIISVFSMWQYAVLGLTLAYVARYRPKVGLTVGAFCYFTMIAFTGVRLWLAQMIVK